MDNEAITSCGDMTILGHRVVNTRRIQHDRVGSTDFKSVLRHYLS